MSNSEVSKPGVRTTEFWVSIAPVVLGLVESQRMDQTTNMVLIICGTALGMAYIVSRTMVKRLIKS
jgi:hypothetical protein